MDAQHESAGTRIDRNDEGDVTRWAEQLCTSPEELRKAIAAVGPEVDRVKRYLFTALIKRGARRPD